MAQFSAEYDAIVESTVHLVKAISKDVGSVLDGLIKTSIIPEQLKEEVRLSTLTPKVKAEKLVDFVTDYIKECPEFYAEFVGVLKSLGRWIEPWVNKLEFCYNAKQQLMQNAVASPTVGVPVQATQQVDVTLSVCHGTKLMKVLKEVRDKWRYIGKGIGVVESDLKEIEDKYISDKCMCLQQMMTGRLQRGGLTRSGLCAVIRGEDVERDDVAKKIEALNLQ